MKEWLEDRARSVSASTIKLESSALAKLYDVTNTINDRDSKGRFKNQWGMKGPSCNRDDFTRSRGEKKRDHGFSVKKNQEIIDFCMCVGPRKDKELRPLRGNALQFVGGEPYVAFKGKGGRDRTAPIVGTPEQKAAIVKRMQAAGDDCVFKRIPSHMDVHAYRSEYAMKIYRRYARSAEELKGQLWYNPKRGK